MIVPIPTLPLLYILILSTPFVLYTVSGAAFVFTRLSGLALIGSASAIEANKEFLRKSLLFDMLVLLIAFL
jgi:hypothetical protein